MNFFQSLKKSFRHSSSRDDLENLAAREQKVFKFATLASATKDFHPTHKLGEGGFGPVYKGRLQDGREIAVKKLSQDSRQGKREFINEAKLLARVQHRNVVNLLGYCTHEDDKLLVYEYVPHESLDKILFKSNRRMELDWKRRFEIICGIARGLLYLHEDAPNTIIHRDIKASNILLDEKWVPKIADFGMARLFPDDETHVNTRIAGTNGYMAPEYVMNGRLSAKADVFSFGVLVLELISGHKSSTFSLDVEEQSLLEWAYKLYKKDKSLEFLDSSIVASAEPEKVKMCIQIGLLCTQYDPQLRPAMSRVVVFLSRKPGHLEEPTQPRIHGSMYQRSNLPSTTTSGRSSLGHSSGSSLNTTTVTATRTGTGSSSASDRKDRWHRDRRIDRHGKRQMWSY